MIRRCLPGSAWDTGAGSAGHRAAHFAGRLGDAILVVYLPREVRRFAGKIRDQARYAAESAMKEEKRKEAGRAANTC